MSGRRALSGFTNWLMAKDRGRLLADAMVAHARVACLEAGVPVAQLSHRLDRADMRRLLDCVVEGIASEGVSGGRSVVDEYLLGAGAGETDTCKDELLALAASAMGLYRIDKVQPSMGFVAQDLLFRGPMLQVQDVNASRQLAAGDIICARIARQNGVTMMTAGFLRLPSLAGWNLQRELKSLFENVRKAALRDDPLGAQPPDAEILKKYSVLFSNAWLACRLDERHISDGQLRASA